MKKILIIPLCVALSISASGQAQDKGVISIKTGDGFTVATIDARHLRQQNIINYNTLK